MKKVNVYTSITGILFVLFLVVPVPSFAQVTYPTPTPVVQTCGIAGSPTASKCCEIVNVHSKLKDEFILLPNDVVAAGIKTVFQAVVNVMFANDNGLKEFERIQMKCLNGIPDPATADDPARCTCVIPDKPIANPQMEKLCTKYLIAADSADPAQKQRLQNEFNACKACADEVTINSVGGYYSALGCIPSDLGGFISNFVLRIGIGFAGVISLLCIIYSAILLQVSRGNPDMIQKARDQITSCIIGLVMIIFSVFILRLIGVDILRIPGFS